jgi:hypothetical protein
MRVPVWYTFELGEESGIILGCHICKQKQTNKNVVNTTIKKFR